MLMENDVMGKNGSGRGAFGVLPPLVR